MPYNPADKVPLKVEIQLGGWVDVTRRGRGVYDVIINEGRSPGADEAEPSDMSLTLGNADGWLTEDNPLSPWYGQVGRGTRIRVSLTGILAQDAVLFDGSIAAMVGRYPGGSDATMQIVAVCQLGEQDQSDDDELESALYRSTMGTSPEDYVPHAYWSMQDDSGARRWVSPIPGTPAMGLIGSPDLAAESTAGGSRPLPVFRAAGDGARAVVPAYAGNPRWIVQLAVRYPSGIGDSTRLAKLDTLGSRPAITVGVDTGSLWITAATSDNLTSTSDDYAWSIDPSDNWAMLIITSTPLAAFGNDAISAALWTAEAEPEIVASVQVVVPPGSHGRLWRIRISGDVDAGTPGLSAGHLAVFVDPLYPAGTGEQRGARALSGWVGEAAGRRIERLCQEEDIALTAIGDLDDTVVMGPQGVGSLSELLRDGEVADQGILSDGSTEGAAIYRTRKSMYHQTPALAVVRGALRPDVSPVWDSRFARNDITSTRPGGSSARAADEAHVARYRRRLKSTPIVKVEADDQLAHDARWRLSQGVAPGPRFGEIGIDMRNTDGAEFADAVLGLRLGDRVTAAESAFPTAPPPGGVDVIVIGRRRELDADMWIEYFNVLPASPYNVGVYGAHANQRGKYGSRNSTLAADITAAQTSVGVSSGGDVWATTASHPHLFPAGGGPGIRVTIGGLVYVCTAITGTNPNYTFTLVRLGAGNDKPHSAGDQVWVTDTGRYGL